MASENISIRREWLLLVRNAFLRDLTCNDCLHLQTECVLGLYSSTLFVLQQCTVKHDTLVVRESSQRPLDHLGLRTHERFVLAAVAFREPALRNAV